MNILFTFTVPSGGVETLNRQRYDALSRKGINCHFLYRHKGAGLQNKVNAPIFISNDETEIKSIIMNGDYAVIIVGYDLLLMKQIREFGYKGIIIYDNQGIGKRKEYIDTYIKQQARSFINQYCDAILCPNTPHLVQAFKKYFPHKKTFYFHNCLNTDKFTYQKHPKRESPIIGWVGRLEENKNWRDFLELGSRLIQENPSIQLWMFEDHSLSYPSQRTAFEQKVKELKILPHLTVYKNQPHHKMADYYSIIGDSGGFLCSTSKVEGFGYAVLEAMVCRCPVLSTDSDGVKSFIIHNVTGKFFEFGNIGQAAQEAKELMNNIPLRDKIREAGVKYIESNFSLETYAMHFIGMLKQLQK
ncbi:glycosyltransferase [Bacillus sp. FJAT-47783]|uniref:glycosyltransferase family 4 protein n=1 Tax=Bacillus sp. FJAT-47783 TaxID=2922712 RepID=UPI001FAB6E75|nr:glycosyltransferase [Bacillus sp. FJAT-47783]